jgi:voltage-gated potassium channel
MTTHPVDRLPRRAPRRLVVRSLLRSSAAAVLLVVAYFVLPLATSDEAALVWLVAGVTIVALLLVWQIRAIVGAEYPRLRAIGALVVGPPLLLVVFATTYLIVSGANASSFSEPLDRTGALYFSVTVFATVGFGDIVPVTAGARIATTIQMVLDVVVLGIAVKLIFGAVETGLRRREAAGSGPAGNEADGQGN